MKSQAIISLIGGASALTMKVGGALDNAVSLLQDMQNSLVKEQTATEVTYQKEKGALEGEIERDEKHIERCEIERDEAEGELAAGENKLGANQDRLEKAEDELVRLAGETEVRIAQGKEDQASFVAQIQELSAAHAAVGKAIGAVSSGRALDKIYSFIQLAAPKSQHRLLALLQDDPPQAIEYSVDNTERNDQIELILTEVQHDIANQLNDETTEKTGYTHNHQKLLLALGHETDAQNLIKRESTKFIAEAEGDIADANSNIAAAKKCITETKEAVAHAEHNLQQTNDQHKATTDELTAQKTALLEAVTMLRDVGGKGSDPTALTQAVSLIATRTFKTSGNQVVAFLSERAETLNSSELRNLAQVVAGAGRLDNVIDMIKKMVQHLEKTNSKELGEKAYCDGALHENKLASDSNTAKLDKADASVTKLSAQNEKLTADVAELNTFISELTATQAQHTQDRNENKDINTKAEDENTRAKKQLENALTILSESFGTSETQTAKSGWAKIDTLLQTVIHDCGVAIDFHAKTEKQQQDTFDDNAHELKLQLVEAESQRKKFNGDLTETGTALTKSKGDVLTHTEEKTSLDQIYAGLEKQCLNPGVSYEVRKQKRADEIQALKEASKILDIEMI